MTQGSRTTTPPAARADAGRRGLGRGLDSLIPAAAGQSRTPVAPAPSAGEHIEKIPVEQIDANPYQTRGSIDEAALAELAASIAANGVLQPIRVRRAESGRYQLVAGERRWLASQRAGKPWVPAIVRALSNEQAMEMTIVENLQREDLNPMEQARAFHRLSSEFSLTQEQMAQRTGKDRTSIANYLRLLRLPEEVQADVDRGLLTFGHAKALLGAPAAEIALKIARRVIADGLSVRQTEELVQRVNAPPDTSPKAPAAKADPNVRQAERDLERALGCRVKIRDRRGKGRITIEYQSLEDFDRVVTALGGPQ